jgi:hypothetical protein
MKKLLTLGLLLTCSFSNAATWKFYGNHDSGKLYIDTDSLAYIDTSKTKRKAWIKIKIVENGTEYRKGQSLMILHYFDCKNDRFKIDDFIHYGTNGRVISSSKDSTDWINNVPESNMANLTREICNL